ncbi:TIGR04372 family glycosyltransferase [Alphaproteobacteria bacterium]|nr:TIGR04372 family glycosyltransferase [Alphaproteobacteria bacterium]
MSIFLLKQFTDIKTGGFQKLISKLSTLLKIISKPSFWINKFFFTPFSIILLLILILLSPFKIIRLGLVHRRLGHFLLNSELYLLEQIYFKNNKYLDIWFLPKDIPNQQVAKMIKRNLNISYINNIFIYNVIKELKKILIFFSYNKFVIGSNIQEDRDVLNLLDQFPTQIKLTEKELKFGYSILNKMNLSLDKPIVCIICRDSSYLNKTYPNMDWSSQNFRDSDINNYNLTAKYLSELGYQVIRMGKVVSNTQLNKKYIFDYAQSKWRSDFLDVFFGYICDFAISNATGWDAIPVTFRKPIAFVNHVPILNLHTYSKKYIHIFKHHYDLNLKKNLNINEIVKRNLHKIYEGQKYKESKIKLIENSPEEILNCVKELINLIKINFEVEKNADERHLWKSFPSNMIHEYNGNKLHGEIKSKFSNYFIENNIYLKFDD